MNKLTIINILLWVLIWNLIDFLITYFNLIGAAVSVWISYLLVCVLSFIDAKKATQGSLENSTMDMVIIGIGVVAQLVLVVFFHFRWSALFI